MVLLSESPRTSKSGRLRIREDAGDLDQMLAGARARTWQKLIAVLLTKLWPGLRPCSAAARSSGSGLMANLCLSERSLSTAGGPAQIGRSPRFDRCGP